MKNIVKICCIVLALSMLPGAAFGAEKTDKERADKVAALIDAIYVQEWTKKTDKQCAAAKAAWLPQETCSCA